MQPAVRLSAQQRQQRAPQLGRRKCRRVQHQVRLRPHRCQHRPFPRYRFFDGGSVAAQRMAPPCLFIAVDDGLGVRLQKQQSTPQTLPPKLFHRAGQPVKGLPGPHVVHESQAVIPAAGGRAELGEFDHHLRRQVVHDVVAAVLQTDGGAALSRTGHSRNNEYFQFSILPRRQA